MNGLVYRLWFRQVLVLPILAVLIASIGFVAGVSCAEWMWWGAVAGAACVGVNRDRRAWLIASGCFAVTLLALWALTHAGVTRTWVDAQQYHLPAVRALVAGWNPVTTATPESLAAFLDLGEGDSRFWMMLAMPKSVWALNAVASFFTHNAFNLFFPAYFLVLVPVMCVVARAFAPLGRVAAVCAICLVLAIVPAYNVNVDTVVALAGIGLLVSMWRALRGESPDWLALFAFSFWMSSAKQTAALHCFLIWLLFLGCWLRTRRDFGRVLALGAVLLVAWAITSVSPLYTSWKNYGHPLYPCYTADSERYPEIDLVADFKVQNEDAARMGRIGRYFNAMVSADVTRWVYAKLTGKPDFRPQAQFFSYNNSDENPTTPTEPVVKLAYWGMIVLVLVFGRKPERLILLLTLVVSLAVPKLMFGYLRYTPWLFWGWLLALHAVQTRFAEGRMISRCVAPAFLVLWAVPFFSVVLNAAILIDLRWATKQVLDETGKLPTVAQVASTGTTAGAGVLAARAYGCEKIVRDSGNSGVPFFTYEFNVLELPEASYYQTLQAKRDRRERLVGYVWLLVKSVGNFFRLIV